MFEIIKADFETDYKYSFGDSLLYRPGPIGYRTVRPLKNNVVNFQVLDTRYDYSFSYVTGMIGLALGWFGFGIAGAFLLMALMGIRRKRFNIFTCTFKDGLSFTAVANGLTYKDIQNTAASSIKNINNGTQ